MIKRLVLIVTALVLYIGMLSTDTFASNNIVVGPSYGGFRVALDSETGLQGYIDEEGIRFTDFIYDGAFDFDHGFGLCYKEIGSEREYYAIDTYGKILKFDKTLGNIDYYNGIFGVSSVPSNGGSSWPIKSALFDANRNLITGYDYEGIYADGLSNIYGEVICAQKDEKWGVINEKGEVLVPIEYDFIQNLSDNWEILHVSKKLNDEFKNGYIKTNGKVLFECKYDEAAEFEGGYGRLALNGKWALVDTNGNFVTEFIYDELEPFKEGIAVVTVNGKRGCIDTSANVVVPIEYSSIQQSENGMIKAVSFEKNIEETLENPLIQKRDINIFVDHSWVYTDQEAIVESGRTLVPVRAISETFGYVVDYDRKTQSIILQNEEKIIYLTINSKDVVVNRFDDGKAPKTIVLDVPARIINGRTFIPLRFIAETIGADVSWNQDNRTINIGSLSNL